MATITRSRSQSSKFDKLAFVKYMKNIGRAYRKQAMELISICRTFVEAQEQSPASDAMLRNVLEFVDGALESATGAGKKAPSEADEKLEKAIQMLSDYEMEYHPLHAGSNVCDRMTKARENDQSSSTILNRLKETFHPIEPQPNRIVEFLIHKSLPDRHPTSVKQVLCEKSHMGEILWNFSRFTNEKKRLRLKQNPQFYTSLPRSSDRYGDKFREQPTENFQVEKIDVLTGNTGSTGRIFLETARNKRAFGNVWFPNNAIIFRDVCGKLEGESVVGEAIEDALSMWCFKELPRPPTPPRSRSPDGSSPSPTTSDTPTHSAEGVQIQDWRKPIREMLDNLKHGRNVDYNVRITARPPISRPGNTGHSHSAPSSPSSQRLTSGSNNSLLSIVPSQSPPPTLQSQITESSAGPPTPSSYRTARNTPLSRQSPVPGLPPSTPARSTPKPSTPPPQPTRIVTPPSPAASPMSHPRQQPTVVLPLTGGATPAPQTAHSAAEISRKLEFQRGTSLEAVPSSSREFPYGTITITAREVRSTPWPHAEGKDGGIGGKLPRQPPDPYPKHAGGTILAPGAAAFPSLVQLRAVDQQMQQGKKNWFQKYVWDYKN